MLFGAVRWKQIAEFRKEENFRIFKIKTVIYGFSLRYEEMYRSPLVSPLSFPSSGFSILASFRAMASFQF